jgi:hypothetical protein
MSGKIFISYRAKTPRRGRGVYNDHLFQHFSQNEIFMDVDTIEPGIDFVEAIEESVSSCDVLIAVIGSRWLTSSDRGGRRRLEIPEDSVRLEIATALKRGIRVVPVLVDGATMPEVGELPDDLKALVRRNALQLSHDRFRTDSQRLASAVEKVLERTATERREREEKERLEAERRAIEAKERLEAERRQKEEQDRLETERRGREKKERLEAEAHPRKEEERLKAEQREKERLEHEPQAQPPSPVAPDTVSTPVAKPEADKPPAETPKVVYPLPPKPTEPKPEKDRRP